MCNTNLPPAQYDCHDRVHHISPSPYHPSYIYCWYASMGCWTEYNVREGPHCSSLGIHHEVRVCVCTVCVCVCVRVLCVRVRECTCVRVLSVCVCACVLCVRVRECITGMCVCVCVFCSPLLYGPITPPLFRSGLDPLVFGLFHQTFRQAMLAVIRCKTQRDIAMIERERRLTIEHDLKVKRGEGSAYSKNDRVSRALSMISQKDLGQ